MEEEDAISIVVLEDGASWPNFILEYQAHAPNSLVEAQAQQESATEFALRVAHRLDGLQDRRQKIAVGILATNAAHDAHATAARLSICRSLLSAMAHRTDGSSGGHGELVLTAGGPTDAQRHDLFALTGALCDELHGTDITVKVRLGQGRLESGTRASVRPTAPEEPSEPEQKLGTATNS